MGLDGGIWVPLYFRGLSRSFVGVDFFTHNPYFFRRRWNKDFAGVAFTTG
jgi:hypothetical protein